MQKILHTQKWYFGFTNSYETQRRRIVKIFILIRKNYYKINRTSIEIKKPAL